MPEEIPAGVTGARRVVAGRYELCDVLGAGGMGVVWRANDQRTESDVAVKLVQSGLSRGGSALALQHEFRAMTQLSHPNLVDVLDYGETEDGLPFFTMEVVEGIDLDRAGAMSFEEIRWVLAEIARALAFIHARGRIHRDIKPSNVRLLPASRGNGGPAGRFGAIKLMDLGLLGRVGTRAPSVAGTPSYLPPEAVSGGVLDQRSDLYSLGVIAYELCTGRLPRRVRSLGDLLEIQRQPLLDPRALRPDIPEDIYLLTLDLLEFEIADRPYDAAEVANRLGRPLRDVDAPEERAYLTSAVCVGRSTELARLREHLRAAAGGATRAAVVRGPAGSGKTRLVRELLIEAKVAGALVLEVGCADQAATPLGLIRALLEPLVALPHARRLLGEIDEAGLLVGLLPGLAGTELPPARDYIDPARGRERTVEVVCAWLAALGREQPVILVIDDLQWADLGSVDALIALIRSPASGSLLVLTTQRLEGDRPPIELPADLVELSPLAPEHVRELLHGMFGVAEPPPALVDQLHATADGSPYFLVELIRSLRESGQIRRAAGRWELAAEPRFDRLPASLEDALDQRIARLSPPARAVAEAMCVLQSEASTAACKGLSGLDNEALFDGLDELVAAELLIRGLDGYRFRHARCRERLDAALEPEDRARRHLATARYLAAEGDEARSAEIGEHFAHGGDQAQAVTYLLRGAEALWRAQAYADLRRPLLLARSLLAEDDERLLLVLARLGRANFYSDHGRAVEQFRWLRDHYARIGVFRWLPRLSRTVGRRPALVIVLAASWMACRLRGRPRSFGQLVQCLLELFTNTTFLASSLAYAGRLTESVATAASLDPLVTSRRRLPRAARLIAEMTADGLQGRLDRSAACCREALHLFATDRKTPVEPYDRAIAVCGAHTAMANSDLWRGRPGARESTALLQPQVEDSEFFFVKALYHQVALWLKINHGTIEEAEAEWELYNATYRHVGHVPLVEVLNRLWLARAWCMYDRLREAQAMAVGVLDRKIGNPYVDATAREVLGWVHLGWGQLDEAGAHFRHALDTGDDPQVDCGTLRMRGHTGLGLVALARAELPAAIEHAQAAAALSHSGDFRNEAEEASARRLLAMAEAARGARVAALEAMRRAEELAALLDSPLQVRLNDRAMSRVSRFLAPGAAEVVLTGSPTAPPRRSPVTPSERGDSSQEEAVRLSSGRSERPAGKGPRSFEVEETVDAADSAPDPD